MLEGRKHDFAELQEMKVKLRWRESMGMGDTTGTKILREDIEAGQREWDRREAAYRAAESARYDAARRAEQERKQREEQEAQDVRDAIALVPLLTKAKQGAPVELSKIIKAADKAEVPRQALIRAADELGLVGFVSESWADGKARRVDCLGSPEWPSLGSYSRSSRVRIETEAEQEEREGLERARREYFERERAQQEQPV